PRLDPPIRLAPAPIHGRPAVVPSEASGDQARVSPPGTRGFSHARGDAGVREAAGAAALPDRGRNEARHARGQLREPAPGDPPTGRVAGLGAAAPPLSSPWRPSPPNGEAGADRVRWLAARSLCPHSLVPPGVHGPRHAV